MINQELMNKITELYIIIKVTYMGLALFIVRKSYEYCKSNFYLVNFNNKVEKFSQFKNRKST